MTSYVDKHAQYYDTIYADKPYAEEAAFVDACLKKYGNKKTTRLLELACGTGRHAFALEKLGYQIVAIDYSPDLLAVAGKRAIELQSNVDFQLQDMRTISLPGDRFGAAYCLFDSIGYVQSNEGLDQVLRSVHQHLDLGGLFIFEFWHAASMLRNYEPRRERKWNLKSEELVRVSTTRLDVVNQLAEVHYDFKVTKSGRAEHFSETQVNRYFLIQEMAKFLADAAYEPIAWYAGYQNEESITEDTWHILAVARSTDKQSQ